MVVKLRQRFDWDNFQAGDQGRFGRVHFGHHHPLVSISASGGSHRQDAARVPDDAIQREFADDEGILHGFEGQAPAQDDDAQGNGQVVSRAFLANGAGERLTTIR